MYHYPSRFHLLMTKRGVKFSRVLWQKHIVSLGAGATNRIQQILPMLKVMPLQ